MSTYKIRARAAGRSCSTRKGDVEAMHKIRATGFAAVFPGQGSQRIGMGKDFFDNIRISRNAYEEASEALGWDVAGTCFKEDEKIHLTSFAQPCILATEIAMFRALQGEFGFSPAYFGGHSLGEYTALVAAGALPFRDTLRVVEARGRLMEEASPLGVGGMAAVITENVDVGMIHKAIEGLPIDVANINSADQVVISGAAETMDLAEARIRSMMDDECLRFVPLQVSGPFHSRFMRSIREIFRKMLGKLWSCFDAARASRVTSNYTGRFHRSDASAMLEALVSQLSSTVRWRDNMLELAGKVRRVIEIGPGRPLRGFFKTIGVDCASITSLSSARRLSERGG